LIFIPYPSEFSLLNSEFIITLFHMDHIMDLIPSFIGTRQDAGLSITQTAHLLHVTPDCVYKWESGQRRLPPAMLELLKFKIKESNNADHTI